jgi:hypothetical protein
MSSEAEESFKADETLLKDPGDLEGVLQTVLVRYKVTRVRLEHRRAAISSS